MKKCNVVKNNRDFNIIISEGRYVKNNSFVIYYMDNDYSTFRFGISVGKKIGNAVVRNYYKRITRHIIDNNNLIYSKDKDYIIMVRKGSMNISFDKLNEDFIYLINKIEKESKNEKTD